MLGRRWRRVAGGDKSGAFPTPVLVTVDVHTQRRPLVWTHVQVRVNRPGRHPPSAAGPERSRALDAGRRALDAGSAATGRGVDGCWNVRLRPDVRPAGQPGVA